MAQHRGRDARAGSPSAGPPRRGVRRPQSVEPDREARGLSAAELGALRGRVQAVVEPVVIAEGLDLDDLAVARAGRRYVVRVVVDGESGIGHDELSTVSHRISSALDAAEESGGAFPAD